MWAIRLARRFCTEAVLWYCVPLVFLAVYVNRYPVSAGSIWPHLHLLAVIYAGVALVRAALFRLIPWPEGSRLASALVVAGSLAVMLLYYGLVIIGLESWGRVISWDLIATYAPQLSELVEAMDLSAPLVLASLGLCYLGLLWVVWAYLGHFDWVPLVMRNLSGPLFAILMICGGTALAIEIHRFVLAPSTHESEPLSLTFFPEQSTQEFQSHGIDSLRARMLMRDDDAARSSYRPNAAVDRKNLILIAIDGLRPDHMGVYGYTRDTTPNLSRLARSGALRRAGAVYATCGESLCGLVSLASSKYMQQFSARPFTLQEVLQRHGYRIHMILGGDHKNFYGLSQFYGNVDSYYDGSSARGGYMNDDQLVLDRMVEFPAWDGVPVMIQFHLMSVHALGKRHNAAMKYLPAANYMVPGSWATESIDESRRGGKAINYYDNGVVQADSMVGGLLEILGHKGYLRDALVVITADHGEALGEHGHFGHANGVHEAVLRVPLLLISYGHEAGPAIDGSRLASHVDVAPTILAELGMPRPETWSGIPLQQPMERDFIYFQQRTEVGLIDARDRGTLWKYWIDTKTGDEHAFNLGVDPAETRNLANEITPERRRDWRLRLLPSAAQPATRPGSH